MSNNRIYELFALFAFHFFNRKIGQELSEDGKFTKPKCRIIAEAYAKRQDDKFQTISVSYQKPFTDPANINFDMIDLHDTKSDPMGQTLTNYLPQILSRRNAIVELPTNCANYASSCADSNSEISFSVRQVSVESRRNSIDSQVSQVSVKLSETNFKTTLNSHTQKHKAVKMKTRRKQRHILTAMQTIRRASSSSVESKRITSQMKSTNAYKNRKSQLNGNANGRHMERRLACTAADLSALNQRLKIIQPTSDEDQRNDDAQAMQMMNDPLKMLAPFNAQMLGDSADSSTSSNGKQSAENLEFIKNVLRNSSDKQLENLLNIYKYGNNSRYPPNNGCAYPIVSHSNQKKIRNDTNLSMSSSMDINSAHQNENQNSMSDHSINHLKTHSQNSKRSCDIGIQANDYDISHARSPSNGELDKDHLPENFQSNYNHDDEYTETHELLPKFRKHCPTSYVRRDNSLSSRHLSPSERNEQVKKLLLP